MDSDDLATKALKAAGLPKYTIAQACNATGLFLAAHAGILAFNDNDGITVIVAAGVAWHHALGVSYNRKRSILDNPDTFQKLLGDIKDNNPKCSLLELRAELQDVSGKQYVQDKKDAAGSKLVALCGLAVGAVAGAAYGYLPPEMKEARELLGYAMFLGPSVFCAGLANLFRGTPYKIVCDINSNLFI